MNFIDVIGIDVSKNVIDVCLHSSQLLKQFSNSKNGLLAFLKWVKTQTTNLNEVLFVFEDTGMYSFLISEILASDNLNYYVASGLAIKRSMGITRGKEDSIDAKRIALYGYRLKEEIQLNRPSSKNINQLKSLQSLRLKLVKQRAGYKVTLGEQKLIYKNKDFKVIFEVQEKMIHYLTKQIENIQSQIQQIIEADIDLFNSFKLISSIKGIGIQMATTMIITTNNFQKFDTWRQFASYSGIAPFPYQSGTSVKGRTKVSHLANKKVKTLIHMCAISAIQHNPEMKTYYLKRVQNGKSKMSTINIIRNKLIARIFAVIKRQTPYVDTMKFAA